MALYWRQRAKINWNYVGDTCSRFFFDFVKGRRARNFIEGIKNGNGEWITEREEIGNIAMSYFCQLYDCNTHASSQNREIEIAQGLKGITASLTEDQKDWLSKPYSRHKIKNALFAMKPWKSPGPDGIQAGFYQKNWAWV
uniref:Uncharacterized protein n=1 Tax=Chenopodium quinoa TaxID=63459 RepID=A0A803MDI0_CHEQI